MLLVSQIVPTSADNPIQRYKAPKGKMYLVQSIACTVTTAGQNDVGVVARLLGNVSVVDVFSIQHDAIANFVTTDRGVFQIVDINHETKFLTIGDRGGAGMSYQIFVYGELVNATRLDLLWEWFRRGAN